nr:SMR family transporter [Acetobacter nitrogenifigens]
MRPYRQGEICQSVLSRRRANACVARRSPLTRFATVLEVVWAPAMKQSLGCYRLWASMTTIVGMAMSAGLLSWSM